MTRRALLAPEVVQSSVMDCGPAALACLLEGHRIAASYDRLREACQTDVDGTSIDTLEEVARELGLEAEQVLLPADHVLRPQSGSLPALVVVTLPHGATHFAVAWSRAGRRVQVMDPSVGRRWPERDALARDLYQHAIEVPERAWRTWAGSAEMLAPLRARLGELGLARRHAGAHVARALADETWHGLAALDGCCRMVESLARAGAVRRGGPAERLLAGLVERVVAAPDDAWAIVPPAYWFARPGSAPGRLRLRGAVLVRVRGTRASAAAPRDADGGERVSAVAAALAEPPTRAGRTLAALACAGGALTPALLLSALALAALTVLVQALLLRGVLDLGLALALPAQRAAALAALVVFLAALALLELPLARSLLRVGRHVESRLRVLFQRALPRLSDAALRSRPSSDMAERAHSIVLVAGVGSTAGHLARVVLQLALTTAGIVWLDASVAPLAVAAALAAVLLPLVAHRGLAERELSVCTLRGALSRTYLEALLGLVALRTHGAERAVRGEHESLLADWWRASLRLRRSELLLTAAQALAGIGFVVAIVVRHFASLETSGAGGGAGSTLLLCYWALALPALGADLVHVALQLPTHRNVARRLLEPIGGGRERAEAGAAPAPSTPAAASPAVAQPAAPTAAFPRAPGLSLRAAGPGAAAMPAEPPLEEPRTEPRARSGGAGGVALELRGVAVRAGGHAILRDVDLAVAAGEHVAIVGPSGAGKSTLLGVVLGWHEPAEGELRADGERVGRAARARLLRATAWVDPSVQLFNRSLLENLRFGNEGGDRRVVGRALELADLADAVGALPGGLSGRLGEGGGLLSGGEGQRARFARALCRDGVRLAILDEPFRGVDRAARTELLRRARSLWRDATVLCATHDLAHTRDFDRVVVVEGGRVVECGRPAELAARPSRYARLLELERALDTDVWGDAAWRRVRVDAGRVEEPER